MRQNLSSAARLMIAAASLLFACVAIAEKTLTIASPSGEKTITLTADPELILSYTPSGIKIDFSNLNIKVVCIEDPSASGVCRLQAYDGTIGTPDTTSLQAAPGAPTATAGDGNVLLSWTAPSDNGSPPIQGYRIQQALAGSTSFTSAIADTGSSNLSATVSGLTNDQGYIFRVAAINSNGVGPNSGSSTAVTPGAGSNTGYASACNGVNSGAVECRLLYSGDIKIGGGDTNFNLPNDKVLTVPFIRDTVAGVTTGRVTYRSFATQDGYAFRVWFSDTPNGPILDGDSRGECVDSRVYAEGILYYADAGSNNPFRCNIASSGPGYVWLNMEFVNSETNDRNAYSIYTFSISGE